MGGSGPSDHESVGRLDQVWLGEWVCGSVRDCSQNLVIESDRIRLIAVLVQLLEHFFQ